ncbi:MAG TPA: gluconokinase [Anaerolineales bacterium]|jgi:gluconokinase|nr:gluconokinase [Anaerolineales bacterium]
MKPGFIIVMGVAGSGKTTVGEALAQRLGWNFYDADAFHPAENITKMANGTPLNDADRAPWLAALHALVSTSLKENRSAVLACSALKKSYREQLIVGKATVQVVYLKGSYDLIWSRISSRKGHYMKPAMLQSQFEALEEPQNAWTFDVSLSVDEIVQEIIQRMEY